MEQKGGGREDSLSVCLIGLGHRSFPALGALDFRAFRFSQESTPSTLWLSGPGTGSPARRWQVMGPGNLHGPVSQVHVINFKYINFIIYNI